MPRVDMSKTKATWWKSDKCNERVRYRTKYAAIRALRHMQERDSSYAELVPEQCSGCDGGWHLVKRAE